MVTLFDVPVYVPLTGMTSSVVVPWSSWPFNGLVTRPCTDGGGGAGGGGGLLFGGGVGGGVAGGGEVDGETAGAQPLHTANAPLPSAATTNNRSAIRALRVMQFSTAPCVPISLAQTAAAHRVVTDEELGGY